MENIYTVSGLTEKLRRTLAGNFPFLWVKGEVTNRSCAASGHIYFSLKDADAQLQCVWFVRRQKQAGRNIDPLTGEVYSIPQPAPSELVRNGVQILCAGSLDVYGPRGQYQLIVELVQEEGVGRLALEFERRKQKLAALGYFAPERKRPLPRLPGRIALITSEYGAAIHDFLELAETRGLSAQIRLFPVPVQGAGAAEKIAAAIAMANAQDWAEVIVLIRGGGSLEDLWAFNEECLARAVFESRLPVMAGIGHEVDFSLTDLTADLRAATPSHAAQLLWPLRTELWQRLDVWQLALSRTMTNCLANVEKKLAGSSERLLWLSPQQKILRLEAQLANLARNLQREMGIAYSARKSHCIMLCVSLPRAAALQSRLRITGDRLASLGQRLRRGIAARLAQWEARLEMLATHLEAVNPQRPLLRGYAMLTRATAADAELVTSTNDVNVGDKIAARLGDGVLEVTVISKRTGPLTW